MTDEALSAAIHARMLAALPAPPDSSTSGDAAKPHHVTELERFARLLRDYPSRAGKFMRGRLVVLSARAHGAASDSAAITVAAALELFQAWVLIHDDIEDDSETRRGQPALHRLVGMPVALNVGDALHVHMWRLLHELLGVAGLDAPTIIAEFATMIDRTAKGQHLDLAYVENGLLDIGEEAYLHMVTLKTAYYTVVTPLRLGALLAGAQPDNDLTPAGIDIGVAFQIRDDVLNLRRGQGATAAYGKEFAGDLFEGKRTLILAHLFANALPSEVTEIGALLAGPRAQRTAQAVDRLLELIDEHGSLDYAQQVAEARATAGLKRLRESLMHLPGREAAQRLLAVLDSVALRES